MKSGARTKLVKVLVQIPNHWFLPAESLWARRARPGQYEIRNIPFFAYDLNLGDIVRARSEDRDSLPEVRSVVRRSGNQTLRVMFKETVPVKKRIALLNELKPLSVTYERWDERYFALNIAQRESYAAVETKLKTLRRKRLITYETCEPRVPGTFDGVPLKRTRTKR